MSLDLLQLTASEQIAALYVAYLGRAPDPDGLAFWRDEYAAGLEAGKTPGRVIADIADSFSKQAEAHALFPFLEAPGSADPGLFVDAVYDNLFNRAPDTAGRAYWIGQIEHRLGDGSGIGAAIADIISGAQNTEAGRDAATIANKAAIGLFYATQYDERGADWTVGDDLAGARDLAAAVTGVASSVVAAEASVNEIVAADLGDGPPAGARPGEVLFAPSGEIADFVLNGTHWTLDDTRTITWSLADGDVYRLLNVDSFWRSWAQTNIFDQISSFIDVTFVYAGHFDHYAQSTADITISPAAQSLFGDPNVLGAAIFPNDLFASLIGVAPGDVFVSVEHPAHNFTNPGSDLVQTVIHEVLHALGLKHPFDDGASDLLGGQVFPQVPLAEPGDVGTSFSIMDYDEANPFWPFGEPATPMMLDAAALQALYGANETTGLGDDTYALLDDGRVRTVWDVAGNDTFDASSNVFGVTIDLHEGALSTISADTKVGIAFGVAIENAVGGAGDDDITGNGLDNLLAGGGGDDALFGEGGTDTALYAGARAEYVIAPGPGGVVVTDLLGRDGTDVLNGIELVGFSDGVFALGAFV